MKNVLLYYPFSFSFGGGDLLPLCLIAALQNVCRLTVALDIAPNLEKASKLFGIEIDMSRINVVQVTPSDYNPKKHNLLSSIRRDRRIKALAKRCDICISTANITDFGRPGHHFINMLAFGDDAFTAHVMKRREGLLARIRRAVMERVARPLLGMRSKRDIIRDRREHIYPNSRYVEKTMTDFYGKFNSTVFYPPTLFETGCANVARDPLKVVYIGRIIPEKRIKDLVAIIEKARENTGLDISFHVAGRLDQTPAYGRELEAMAQTRPWLKFTGALYAEAKAAFLLSGSYALHAERIEAFGISVAEYLASGNIAIVPDEGGSSEVVATSALAYRNREEAAAILSRLLTDGEFRDEQRRACADRAKLFSRGAYMSRQHELVERLLRG